MIMVALFIYPPVLFKLVDLSQIFSLLVFLDMPDLFKVKSYLADLRLDVWVTLFPNAIAQSSKFQWKM